jgi:hypothetical protein
MALDNRGEVEARMQIQTLTGNYTPNNQGALPPVSIRLPQPSAPGMPEKPEQPGVILELGRANRTEEPHEPCKTCQNRSYADSSSEGNVSMKGGANIHPGAAASAVFSHEREHVANAMEKARQIDGNAQATVRIHTDVCPECKKVYVSGGTTEVTISAQAEEPDPIGKLFDAAV